MGPTQQQSEPASSCIKCGHKSVRPRTRPGRTLYFRHIKALPVPADIPIPTCARCHAEYIDAETAARLEPALLKTYREDLSQRVRLAIETVTQYISQRKLENLLGLSQGYLSRLRAGHGNPSPELVSHLALLAYDPPSRLMELQNYWATPTDIIARKAQGRASAV